MSNEFSGSPGIEMVPICRNSAAPAAPAKADRPTAAESRSFVIMRMALPPFVIGLQQRVRPRDTSPRWQGSQRLSLLRIAPGDAAAPARVGRQFPPLIGNHLTP